MDFEEFSKDNVFFAFSDEQFEKGLKEINAVESEVSYVGNNCYCLTSKIDELILVLKK